MIKALIFAVLAIIAVVAAQESQKIDLQVLQFALTLEHLEATFYAEGIATFSVQDMINAGHTAQDWQYLNEIAAHEATHVSTLSSVITSLGGTPTAQCNYTFPYGNNFTLFLTYASLLENTGVSAYDGAIDLINVPALATAAATIATVEGRHAAYLNTLIQKDPFPSAFDTALNMTTILAAAGGFITSCPASNSQCNSIGATAANVCSGNGVCMYSNLCICNSGFEGTNCESAATVAPTCAPGTVVPISSSTTTVAPTTGTSSTTVAPTTTSSSTTVAPTTGASSTTVAPTTASSSTTVAPTTEASSTTVAPTTGASSTVAPVGATSAPIDQSGNDNARSSGSTIFSASGLIITALAVVCAM